MPKSLADKLRAAIEAEMAKGRSLRDIARAADISPSRLSDFMKGKSLVIETAEAIAKAIGIRIDAK